MNFYIVVEGKRSEKKVYPKWISYLNPSLTEIKELDCFHENNFYIVSGMGYPYYFEIIENAILDFQENPNIDYLVISIDSEDMDYEEKYFEIESFIKDKINLSKVKIIIQHFCLETWALGNKYIFKRNPEDKQLREYIRTYNVKNDDPEFLPSFPKYSFNRAQFAMDYLKRCLKEKYSELYYTKSNPTIIAHVTFYQRIFERYNSENHIKSFGKFIDTFK